MTATDLASLPGVAAGAVQQDVGVPSSSSREAAANEACFQKIQRDAAELDQLAHNVETAIDDGLFWHCPSLFARLLSELRDQAAMHFTLEEAYGRNGAGRGSPEPSSLAESLHAEHLSLYRESDRIAERAEAVACRPRCYRRQRLACRTLAFLDQLQRHERREADLLRRIHDTAAGAGD
jgi:hypothetical protein